jgi:hypothetical protein
LSRTRGQVAEPNQTKPNQRIIPNYSYQDSAFALMIRRIGFSVLLTVSTWVIPKAPGPRSTAPTLDSALLGGLLWEPLTPNPKPQHLTALCWVDSFGNIKTSCIAKDCNFEVGKTVTIRLDQQRLLTLECFRRLKDIPGQTPCPKP